MTAKAQLQSAGDGTAIPAGSVGEKVSGSSAGLSLTSAAARTATASAITLSKGTWLIQGMAQYATGSVTSFSRISHVLYNITTSTEVGSLFLGDRASSIGDSPRMPVIGTVIIVNQDTQIGLNASATWATGGVSLTAVLEAVRIA